MAEKKFDKQKLLTVAVTGILIFFFVGGFWIGLERVRSMEGTFPPNDIKQGLTDAPETAEQARQYLDFVLNMALEAKPSLSYDAYFSVDGDSLETDGSDTLKSTMLFALDSFEDHISSAEESEDKVSYINFGGAISSLLKLPAADALKVTDFTCSYIYYSCPSCGETSDEQLPSCEPCGSQREYYKKYRDEYDIVLTVEKSIAPGTVINDYEEAFAPRTGEEISALTDSVLADSVKLNSTEIEYNKYKISFRVNRLTNKITSLTYIKDMTASADFTFIGKYEALGSGNVSFAVNEYMKYSFTWPALTLDSEVLEIEPKGTDNLLATLTCEDPLAMTVTWRSSDESIATVDADGYISTTAKTGEAVITASYEYLGETYSDSCLVLVKVPVESMKMSKKNIDLSVGDTFTLSTKISPKKATIQTVKWYSENEATATVDEHGVVTAVSPGEVIVYALSDDG